MENNFEAPSGTVMPKINIRKYITKFSAVSLPALFLAGVLVGIVAWQFGWKKLENSVYQKGLEQGKQEMNTLMLQQIQQLYDAGQQINFKIGGKTIIFSPVK